LMSDTSMTKEMVNMVEAFGWGVDDLEWITVNSVKSAFAAFPDRLRIINGVVKPHYALLRAETAFGTAWSDG
jgi:adenosine deaminase